jgi:hypothetical protein
MKLTIAAATGGWVREAAYTQVAVTANMKQASDMEPKPSRD